MDVDRIGNKGRKIKVFLVFFCVASILVGCQDNEKIRALNLEYEDDKAVRISFESDGNSNEFSVYLINQKDIPILGSFSEKNGHILFTPVIPFSNDHEFGIAHKGKQIASFRVGVKSAVKIPELLAIYPRHDTVPENILKMYFEFSQPMQHVGNPLNFITVIDTYNDTEVYPFLDIEAELWNKNRTRLTLWFDPGRIKTDLIPNKEKGLPLEQNHAYIISIDKSWNSVNGIPLAKSYSKTIYVNGKDTKSPNPSNWTIAAPEKNTKNPLKIGVDDNLDPILALECIKLFKGDVSISGNLELSYSDKTILFNPDDFWKAGDYDILINPILEDLAGNNLQDLFDSDLRIPEKNEEIVTILKFNVK